MQHIVLLWQINYNNLWLRQNSLNKLSRFNLIKLFCEWALKEKTGQWRKLKQSVNNETQINNNHRKSLLNAEDFSCKRGLGEISPRPLLEYRIFETCLHNWTGKPYRQERTLKEKESNTDFYWLIKVLYHLVYNQAIR